MVLPLLLAACSVRAAEVEAVGLLVLAAQAVQAVVAQVVVVAEVAAARMLRVRADLAALAGPWFWSFDHAAICSC